METAIDMAKRLMREEAFLLRYFLWGAVVAAERIKQTAPSLKDKKSVRGIYPSLANAYLSTALFEGEFTRQQHKFNNQYSLITPSQPPAW